MLSSYSTTCKGIVFVGSDFYEILGAVQGAAHSEHRTLEKDMKGNVLTDRIIMDSRRKVEIATKALDDYAKDVAGEIDELSRKSPHLAFVTVGTPLFHYAVDQKLSAVITNANIRAHYAESDYDSMAEALEAVCSGSSISSFLRNPIFASSNPEINVEDTFIRDAEQESADDASDLPTMIINLGYGEAQRAAGAALERKKRF